ncbi:MAG: flagellar basal body-associated FliL family protein [Termitinemataceae bacterium]
MQKTFKILERILLLIAALLILLILAGTIYAVLRPRLPSGSAPKNTSSSATNSIAAPGPLFTGLGRIRSASADPNPATIIVSVVFPYPADDSAFTEELLSHLEEFKSITRTMFSRYTTAELNRMGEDAIKTELLKRFNGLLRLGSIEVIYFNDYLIIE